MGGQRTRKRVPHGPTPRGKSCDAAVVEQTEPCAAEPCEGVVCGWEVWSAWTDCDEDCGVGQQNRSRALAPLSQISSQLYVASLPVSAFPLSRAGLLAFLVGLAGVLALQR